MYLLFEMYGVDMVQFVEVAYIAVEVVEEDTLEEDFDIEEVLEAYKYSNAVNNYFVEEVLVEKVVGHIHYFVVAEHMRYFGYFVVVEHKRYFVVVGHIHYFVVVGHMDFVVVGHMHFEVVGAYMYLNVVKAAEEVMAEEEPLVEEEDIQDFDKGLEAYMYLIYGNY
jgi:hypothetical protein